MRRAGIRGGNEACTITKTKSTIKNSNPTVVTFFIPALLLHCAPAHFIASSSSCTPDRLFLFFSSASLSSFLLRRRGARQSRVRVMILTFRSPLFSSSSSSSFSSGTLARPSKEKKRKKKKEGGVGGLPPTFKLFSPLSHDDTTKAFPHPDASSCVFLLFFIRSTP